MFSLRAVIGIEEGSLDREKDSLKASFLVGYIGFSGEGSGAIFFLAFFNSILISGAFKFS